jgi:pimeloyl-ACP methyl ester carboxylesterase
MALLKWLIGAAAAFGGLVAQMYVAQRSLMYFPERLHTPPTMAGLPEAQEVALDTKDGERVIVWHVPPRGEKLVVLYFHGNGGALRNRVARFRALIADGNGLIALSYRGYGGSTGSPTEAGLIADAEAAYAFAAARYPAERIVLWGESLGSGVAVALGAGHRVLANGFMLSPASPSSSCAFPMPVTKRSTCTVRRMSSGRFSCLLRRRCATGRSRSYGLHDLGRDNGKLSEVRLKETPLPRTVRYTLTVVHSNDIS